MFSCVNFFIYNMFSFVFFICWVLLVSHCIDVVLPKVHSCGICNSRQIGHYRVKSNSGIVVATIVVTIVLVRSLKF